MSDAICADQAFARIAASVPFWALPVAMAVLPIPSYCQLRNLIEVPQELDDDHAVFTEPLASVYQILRQLTIEGRPYITVLGDGRLGLLCAQISKMDWIASVEAC